MAKQDCSNPAVELDKETLDAAGRYWQQVSRSGKAISQTCNWQLVRRPMGQCRVQRFEGNGIWRYGHRNRRFQREGHRSVREASR